MIRCVAVGASLGGLDAIIEVFAEVDREFPCPILLVQHRSADSSPIFEELLRSRLKLEVVTASDDEETRPGCLFVAPPNYHLLVDRETLRLSTEGRVRHARPSIDVLFESVADCYADGALAVVLTGASNDGAEGASAIRRRGGGVWIQDPVTARSPVCPSSAAAEVPDADIFSLAELRERFGAINGKKRA